MQENAIYTAVIKKKNIILSEYTDYSGNFEQTIKKMMKNISDKNIENDIYKATIFISKLKIFILKKSEIYLILISDIKEYDEEKNNYAFCFLYSIATKLYELYNPEELKHAKAFTLIDFKKILEQHITNFRSNIKYYKEYLQNISSYTTENSLNKLNLNLNLSIHSISQVHQEHPQEYDPLEMKEVNSNNSLNELSLSLIANDSDIDNKKSNCCKYIIIIIIILLLGLGIFAYLKFYLHKI